MKRIYPSFAKLVLPVLLIGLMFPLPQAGEGTPYRNPVLFADYSDPDVIRVGDDFYLVSSSFQSVPGLPILHSRDLVNWTLVSLPLTVPSPTSIATHGNGIWRPHPHHDGLSSGSTPEPPRGLFMTRARDVRGPWNRSLSSRSKGFGSIPSVVGSDGSMYLVHAWAKSRAGFNSILTVNRMSADGRRVVDEGTVVFDGRERQPTIEGPKFYKRNGWYYIFAPAGGVKSGWQTVLRSKNIFGPYEDKIVLARRNTINGHHQGAWVETADSESWFLHIQTGALRAHRSRSDDMGSMNGRSSGMMGTGGRSPFAFAVRE